MPSRALAAVVLALLLTPGVLAQSVPDVPPEDPENWPDLVVSRTSVTPARPVAGDPVEICATFQSYGNRAPAAHAAALVFLQEEVAYERYAEMPANGTRLCVTLTLPAGSHDVTAIVDVDEEVRERHENNNRRTFAVRVSPVPLPELFVESFQVTPREPDARNTGIRAAARITNDGGAPASNVTVAILFDDKVLHNFTFRSVPSGGTVTAQQTFMVSELPGGDHVLTVRVDPENLIEEFSERNNEMNTPVRIPPPEGPDLTVVAARWLREDGQNALVEKGDAIRLEATVANRGTTAAPQAWVNFTLDDGGTLGKVITTRLLPGDLTTVSLLWSAEPGNWTVRATIEPDNPAAELNATNNARTTRINVEPPIMGPLAPDVAVTRLTHAPTPAVAGRDVNLTATVQNRGNADARPFLVALQVNGEEISRRSVDGLPPGGAIVVVARWIPPTQGPYTVDAILLSANGTADANATRDAASTLIEVRERGYRPATDPEPPEAPPQEEPREEAPPETPEAPPSSPPTLPEPSTELGRAEAVSLRVAPANGTANGYVFTLLAANPTDGLATAFRVQFLVDGATHGAPVDVAGITPASDVEVTSPVWTGEPGEHTVEARIVPVDGSTAPQSAARASFTVEGDRGLPLAPGLALLALGAAALRRRR